MEGIFVITLVVSLQLQDTLLEQRTQRIEQLAKQLEDEASHVRFGAIRDARIYEFHDLIPQIAAQLKDESPKVREEALSALADLDASEPKYALQIAKLLDDGDSHVRATAVLVLGELGATKFRFLMVKLLDDQDETVRHYAQVGLNRLDR